MKDNPVFGSFGRFQETPKAEMPPDMKAAFDFTMRLRGEVPGPHKIWICNPKLSETIVQSWLQRWPKVCVPAVFLAAGDGSPPAPSTTSWRISRMRWPISSNDRHRRFHNKVWLR